ncbi:DDB1- and CUL4-associated factor 1 isoform X2 [Anoplophora glabripennis]|uniref:DDB1- and CUL4-associated factor 1 isoform X2 n=1 Tax=Anoplophora glabripennis TaxID=217634 RepID=UPI00087361B0|nr:DDB1- and CUL4-associated factor 1 isoform X2 [Anoplophora glabripennis]
MAENSNNTSVMTELTNLIRAWEDEHTQANYDPVPTLTRLAEIIEVETENYLKMDPDPFDERHPSRTDPECKLGQILKALFRKDNFMNKVNCMNKLVNDYLRDSYYSRSGVTGRDVNQLNIAACRLMLDVMPGLETSVVFQPDMDSLIHRLIKWVMNSIEPLQSYATGLLAAAMEIPEIATRFREHNSKLVPLLLQRLRRLKCSSEFAQHTTANLIRPFAHLSSMRSPPYRGDNIIKTPSPIYKWVRENGISNSTESEGEQTSSKPENVENREIDAKVQKKRKVSLDGQVSTPSRSENSESYDLEQCPRRKKLKLDNNPPPIFLGDMSPQKGGVLSETSNSSWAELESFMIGTVQIFPPTIATRQILILRYLTPMGEYQEFLSHVFENDALELILCYVNVRLTKEARLAFEALKYLAALLCHKKFSIEFIHCKGLETLLEVPRPSIAATGVSICLYYLGYCEEAMERVCLLPKFIISNLVKYALWLLECSHDSGRCHAIMFFGLTFQFKVILEEFDAQDGLRKLHNVIATLPILLPDNDTGQLNEDQEGAARQIVRHVCVAYRRYLEAHLNAKVELIRRSQLRPNERLAPALPSQPSYKACKSSPEEIQQQIDMLFQNMPFRSHWVPVDHLLKLGGITLLLKIIAFAYEWNYSGRAETVRSALDVLAIACVMPKVQLLFCDRVDLPEETLTVGLNIILGAAEGEIVADADVQKSALRVIGNCVCAPINRVGGSMARFSQNATNSPNKKLKFKSSEELIQKVWDCVRSNSGIMVLLQLMQVKTPITDADCIRTLACKALAGLARSETVRQIVSKLPLFTSGQLQNLMRDPILQEKRQEHVLFQKYALELLELLSGRGNHTGNELEASLVNIHRANVVAQTKILFNDRQLLQLIHQHLVQKGYTDTAGMLVKEANLSNAITSVSAQHPTKFRYSSTLTPTRIRLSFSSPNIHRALPSMNSTESTSSAVVNGATGTSPATIKIIKKNQNIAVTPVPNSRLQKQISCEPHVWLPEDISSSVEQPRVTLDSIITEYLTNQHALCKNPMATCPQFNLFIPHKCPDPKPRITTANNFAIRCARRSIGYQSKTLDRRFVHSRFCPVQTIRSTTDEGFFTCAKFMPGDHSIVVGDYNGEIHLFSLHTGNEIHMFSAHDNYIVHVEPNRTGEFMLTSCTWGKPVSALWNMKTYEMKIPFNDEEYVEFNKVAQDKILGTKGEIATIYDANTGNSISRLTPSNSNQYTKNKATFSYNDELVLSDGVLFDVSSGKQIHKLDKLNQTQSGVFHPNGLEIVSNTEVWDIRTFHLLKTVPVLNQCSVIFSPVNTAIYAISMEQEMDDGDSTFDSSFKTVDAIDYSSITTFDVKKSIYDLATNRYDTQIAIVENQGMYNSVQESVVRLYDVGRRRDDEDEQDEEEEDDDMGGSDDDNSDNDVVFYLDGDNNDNNDNNDDDNGDDDDDNDSDSESWTSLSTGNDSSIGTESLLGDLLFEY